VRLHFLVAAAMVPVFWGIYYSSYLLRFEGDLGPEEKRIILATAGWIVAGKLLVFLALRIHQGWSRPVTFYDLVALGKATTLSMVVTFLAERYVLAAGLIPRSIYLLDWGTTIVAVGGARSVLRGFRELAWASFLPSNRVPTLIVGVNDASELLLRAIIRDGKRAYRVLGFVDRDAGRLGAKIAGVPIIGTLENIWALAERYGVPEILVVKAGLPGVEVRRLIETARRRGLEVRVLPSYEQLLSGSVSIQPRPVSIDDLLHREPVELGLHSIRSWIDHRVLLVTGSAGSIGSEISRQLLRFSPARLILVDRAETPQFYLGRELGQLNSKVDLDLCVADVLDRRRMQQVFRRYRPDIVFHGAAYKHVPLMEEHPGEAVKNIVLATQRLADVAVEHKVQSFVMISTDKAVNPSSVMGACKRIAELYVQSLNERRRCQFVTVRFGNVLDSAGSVVPIFREQIARGGPVTVTHPQMQRYFMTISEAARLVIQAGAIGQGRRILTLDMGEPVRVVDLANEMIRLSGLQPGADIEIAFVGLRPGEKLVEELFSSGEKLVPTEHPKISVAEHSPCDYEKISSAVFELEQLLYGPPQILLAKLHEIVPEYRLPGYGRPELRAAA
jgi:FlaA1/EpsC-like NDP-sugar epimerase